MVLLIYIIGAMERHTCDVRGQVNSYATNKNILYFISYNLSSQKPSPGLTTETRQNVHVQLHKINNLL